MDVEIKKLYEKYLNLKMPKKYSFSEAQNIFLNEYLAKEIDIKELSFLIDSQEVKIFDKAYIIDKVEILNSLFTEEEKQQFLAIKEMNTEFPLNYDQATKSEIEYSRIQEGEYLLVFLGINKNNYIRDIKLIGNSEKLYDRLIILMGIDQEESYIENKDFQEYIKALSNLGYLDNN
ncbi:hypothetical protein SFC55_20475 [Niallia taxi]|uniref:hypothetical protein n=1 Tax=Niallia taxi TaxID=2499688 RepID=UPI003982AFA4